MDQNFFISECSGAIPATPDGASVTYDGSDTAGTVVTYTCSGGHKVFAVVSKVLLICRNVESPNPWFTVSCQLDKIRGKH